MYKESWSEKVERENKVGSGVIKDGEKVESK